MRFSKIFENYFYKNLVCCSSDNIKSNSISFSFYFLDFAIGEEVAIKQIPIIPIVIRKGKGPIPKNINVAPVKATKIPIMNNTMNSCF